MMPESQGLWECVSLVFSEQFCFDFQRLHFTGPGRIFKGISRCLVFSEAELCFIWLLTVLLLRAA